MTNKQDMTLDQQRANHAWRSIEDLKRLRPNEQKEYAGEAKKLPVRIMNSGLGQALAFIRSKARDKKTALSRLHDDLTDWTLKERGLPGAVPDSLLVSICKGDALFLRRATDEVLAYLEWLNRFAEAEGMTDGTEQTA